MGQREGVPSLDEEKCSGQRHAFGSFKKGAKQFTHGPISVDRRIPPTTAHNLSTKFPTMYPLQNSCREILKIFEIMGICRQRQHLIVSIQSEILGHGGWIK